MGEAMMGPVYPEPVAGGDFIEDICEIDGNRGEEDYDGYVVRTRYQTIELMIHNKHQCCESFGYFLSEDDPKDFIGAELLDVVVVDTDLLSTSLSKLKITPAMKREEEDEGHFSVSTMFVNLITTKGVLQFVAYNGHNGYYGHKAYVISQQCKHIDVL